MGREDKDVSAFLVVWNKKLDTRRKYCIFVQKQFTKLGKYGNGALLCKCGMIKPYIRPGGSAPVKR